MAEPRKEIERICRFIGVLIESADEEGFAEEYYAQLQDVFAKQSLVPTYPVNRPREFFRRLYPSGRLLWVRARNADGTGIATGIFPADNGVVYSLGGASVRLPAMPCQTDSYR